MGTIGTRGLKRTEASGIQETHRMTSGDEMVASTHGSEVLNWTHGGQINRYSRLGRTGHGFRHPGGRGRPSRTQDGFTHGSRSTEGSYPVGSAESGMEGKLASRQPGQFTNTAVPKFD